MLTRKGSYLAAMLAMLGSFFTPRLSGTVQVYLNFIYKGGDPQIRDTISGPPMNIVDLDIQAVP